MSEKPYTYDDLVHDLHRAINSKQNPRQAYNFLRALCGMPAA